MRHLLAKLRDLLRDSIIKFYSILETRKELIALASRIKAIDKSASYKRIAIEPIKRESTKKKYKLLPLN